MSSASDSTEIAARLARVRARVAAAEDAAGRPRDSVRLLLATKTQPLEVVRIALEADAAARAAVPAGDAPRAVLVGENRVQELVAKAPHLHDLTSDFHLIGPLQSNKVNQALGAATCIESVDSVDLARRLATRCVSAGRVLDVLVQVNVSGEVTKHGLDPAHAVEAALEVAALDGLRLRGFMTVGARSPEMDVVRAGYSTLRGIRDRVLASGAAGTGAAGELSMGMSGDLEAAVAEDATIVRVGTGVFGARPPVA
ncbi:YggS family pyridoxal phosphate-dependent enzyme [Cellulomonas sp. P22]|uniref:YggS family pyridoxal phosphate-dependent enzyme n=1 Tax=Cellulomonas sp. P22 TaxID=3373189 RepID=UPI0037B0BA4B